MSTRRPSDTDPAIRRVQDEALRRMTPEQRLRIVDELNRSVETLAIAGIRDAFPEASDREVFLRLAVRKLGYRIARQVYPEIDRLNGARR